MNYILDTNVISELVARHPNERVVTWVDAQEPTTVYLTVITIGELQKGITKLPPSPRKERLQAWMRDDLLVRFDGQLLPLTTEVMFRWGELTATLEQGGTPMPAIDSLIAAIALQGNFTLATRNEADFAHTSVTVINPWK
jgi:toxin FitB